MEKKGIYWYIHNIWLCNNGSMPTCSWFLGCLSTFCPPEIAGQSMHAGGATALAEAGAPGELIQGVGRWSSNAFERYICKNVIVLHALILSQSLHCSCKVWPATYNGLLLLQTPPFPYFVHCYGQFHTGISTPIIFPTHVLLPLHILLLLFKKNPLCYLFYCLSSLHVQTIQRSTGHASRVNCFSANWPNKSIDRKSVV